MRMEDACEEGFTVIWTDGSSRGNGRVGATAGMGVYFGPSDPRNLSERLPGVVQTNNRAELTAIIRALEAVAPDANIVIKTDSQYSVSCFTIWAQSWIRRGWKNSKGSPVENRDLIQKGLELLKRPGVTKFVKVRAHIGTAGNEAADHLANMGALKEALHDSEPMLPDNAKAVGPGSSGEEPLPEPGEFDDLSDDYAQAA